MLEIAALYAGLVSVGLVQALDQLKERCHHQGISHALGDIVGEQLEGAIYNRMKLLLLGSILLIAMVACAASDPTVPEDRLQDMKDYLDQAIAEVRTEPDKTQEEVIELYPTAADSSIHAEVGDLVLVQVNVSSHSGCKDLKVKDPFGNAAIELAPKEVRNEVPGFNGVQFQGAFFATAVGEYTVELDPDSENLSCSSRGSPASAEVKWTVQPN